MRRHCLSSRRSIPARGNEVRRRERRGRHRISEQGELSPVQVHPGSLKLVRIEEVSMVDDLLSVLAGDMSGLLGDEE